MHVLPIQAEFYRSQDGNGLSEREEELVVAFLVQFAQKGITLSQQSAEARKEAETRSQALAALFLKQFRSDSLRRCARLAGLPEAQFVAGVRSMAERRAAAKLLARKRAVDSPFFVRDEVSGT